ncbi:hypothetical protein [Halomonas heilongjiangensis]|uniref:hypothetical protein n=1 Tax=Halomonas heilongjiangensis TaxID=1387883 RepID=UPI0011AF798B|nr:hypothetical protein [Halomonas heilongjiangensis]
MSKLVNGHKPLHKHCLFWGSIAAPLLTSLGLAYWFGIFHLPFDPSPDGVVFFYEHAKLFMAIAALSIPFGATFSRIHSSKQTADSLSIVVDKNNKEFRQSVMSSFLDMLSFYNNREFGFGQYKREFDQGCIPSPLHTFNYFFDFDDDLSVRRESVFQVMFRCVEKYQGFLEVAEVGPEDCDNYLNVSRIKADRLIDFSKSVYGLCAACGVSHKIPGTTVHLAAGDILKRETNDQLPFSSYFTSDDPELEMDTVQVEGLSKLTRNLFSVASCLYYVAEISSGFDDVYSKEMRVYSRFFYVAGMQLSGGVSMLGTEDAQEVVPQWSDLSVPNRKLCRYWGGRFFLDNKWRGYRAMQKSVASQVSKLMEEYGGQR